MLENNKEIILENKEIILENNKNNIREQQK